MAGAGGTGGIPAANRSMNNAILTNLPALGLSEAWAGKSPEELQQSAAYVTSHPGEFELQGGHLVPQSYPGEGQPVGSIMNMLAGSLLPPGVGDRPQLQTQGGAPAQVGDPAMSGLASYLSNNYAQLGLGEAWGDKSPTERKQSGAYVSEHPNEFKVQEGRLTSGAPGAGESLNRLPWSGVTPQKGMETPPWGGANPMQHYDPWWAMPQQDPVGYAPGYQRSPWGTPYGEGLGTLPPGVQAQSDLAKAGGAGTNPTVSTSKTTTGGGGGAGAAIGAALSGPMGAIILQQLLGNNTLTQKGIGAAYDWIKEQFTGPSPLSVTGSTDMDVPRGTIGDSTTAVGGGGSLSDMIRSAPPDVQQTFKALFPEGIPGEAGSAVGDVDLSWLNSDLSQQAADIDWTGLLEGMNY